MAAPLDCQTAALAYAARGWHVLPLTGKLPLTAHAYKDATTDPDTIRLWWERWPEAGVGIATGASGLLVLDVDPRHGGDQTLESLMLWNGPMPDTLRARTGGGGEHWYFAASPCPNYELAPGLEVKSATGYVVAPPSPGYAWTEKHPPAQLPNWLRYPEEPRAKPPEPLPDKIPVGERHKWLTSLAGTMRRRGASEAAMLAALQVENDRCAGGGLIERELAQIAHSVARYEPGDDFLSAPIVEAGVARLSSAAWSAAEYVRAEIPKPRALLGNGILNVGGLAVFYGKPGTSKTWLGLRLGLCIARGEPWFGIDTAPEGTRVGMIQLELSGYALRERLVALGAGTNERDENFQIVASPQLVGGVNLLDATDFAAVERLISDHRLELLIIDALSRSHAADENDAQELGPLLSKIDTLRRASGCAILFIHHERKSSGNGGDDDMDALRGHSRLQSDPTLLMRLRLLSGNKLRCLMFTKVSEGETPQDIYFQLGEDGLPELMESPQSKSQQTERMILECIRTNPGIKRPEITSVSGVSDPTVKRYVKKLLDQNAIIRSGRGVDAGHWITQIKRLSDPELTDDDSYT